MAAEQAHRQVLLRTGCILTSTQLTPWLGRGKCQFLLSHFVHNFATCKEAVPAKQRHGFAEAHCVESTSTEIKS